MGVEGGMVGAEQTVTPEGEVPLRTFKRMPVRGVWAQASTVAPGASEALSSFPTSFSSPAPGLSTRLPSRPCLSRLFFPSRLAQGPLAKSPTGPGHGSGEGGRFSTALNAHTCRVMRQGPEWGAGKMGGELAQGLSI